MRKNTLFNIATFLLMNIFWINITLAQTVSFTFANAQNTNDGSNDYYEVDVMIAADSDFKLGSGLLYFNYNTSAFGTNVLTNGNIEFAYDAGSYILGEEVGTAPFVFGIYSNRTSNDNTTSRVAFSWQQSLGDTYYSSDNVTSTATALFHIKIKYTDVNEDPSFCFESGSAFDDQTYTACGTESGGTSADCQNSSGTQLTSDNFDCASASLPVELLHFTAEPYGEDALLTWATANETNSSHFDVERSTDGIRFEKIGEVAGAGTTTFQQSYDFTDENPVNGENYYRLRQVDFDGKYEYTDIQVVIFEGGNVAKAVVSVFPNPTVHTLNIKSNQTGIENIQIFNNLGQMVLEQQTTASEYTHIVDVEKLTDGAYYIKVNGTDSTIKFIKQ